MSFGKEAGLLGPAVAAGELVGVKNWSLPGDVGERGGVLMGVLCGDGTGEGWGAGCKMWGNACWMAG